MVKLVDIDLGTTNFRDSTIIANAEGRRTTPSVHNYLGSATL